ncbi:hypothetical protein CPB84DRAFT_1776958 [Gymnopilus junonius]|uniref:Uncharacterized protein n=1 Tax=Gymnopilus junonius TaxID=109634 RepID=A0A9P5NRX3_GYMJU|nr:hypothetical protein CPB84DRAFT_1776958 [Gymnopilus junonius]
MVASWINPGSSTDKHSHHTIDGGVSKEELLAADPKKEGGSVRMDDHKPTAESVQVQVSANRKENQVSERISSHSSRRNTEGSVASLPRRQDVPVRDDHHDREWERKRKYERERDRADELAKDVESLKQKLQASHTKLADERQQTKSYERKSNDIQKERDSILRSRNEQIKIQMEKVQAVERRLADAEARNRKQETELQILREKLRASEEKQSRMASLLEERTSDLKGVQPFLTTADRYSGAEIIKMVEGLNAEIFQAAAFMAELVVDDSMIATKEEYASNMEHFRENLDSVRREIGKELFTYLATRSGEVRQDPLPLQLGIQHLLTAWYAHKVESFSSGPLGTELRQLYQRIRTSEIQAIAGRWRAITSSHMQDTGYRQNPHIIFSSIAVLLILCGWSWESKGSQKVIPTMQKKISTIEEQCIRLKAAVKEGITTADMDIVYAVPGTEFGENMADSYADVTDGSAAVNTTRKELVLCTVGMGLQKTLIKRGAGREVTYQEDVLVKPKVALVSVLQEENHEESIRDKTIPQQPPTESLPQHMQDGK